LTETTVENAFRSGKRVCLKPIEAENAALFQTWVNEPENQQYIGRFRPMNGIEERRWLESLHEKSESHFFAIALREGGRLIGNCALAHAALPHRTGTLGILIGEAEHQGQGYGAEAIRLLLEYGFATLGLHRVALDVVENNERGIRCYEKCGFRREGTRRQARWWSGRWWNVHEYAILEHEWREQFSLPRNAAT
jgi:RimJ/RimL family protein N-acetyltransferase